MNNTLAMESAPRRSLLHSNPLLSRLSRVTERSESDAATYTGIASKTAFFLLLTLVGIVAQLLVKAIFASEPVWQTVSIYDKFTVALSMNEAIVLGVVLVGGFIAELLGIFLRKSIPVTGTLYSVSQGYLISFLVFDVLNGYEALGLEALLLTVAVVAVMSWLYTSGRIRDNGKFRTLLLTLFLGSVLFGVLSTVGFLIPVTRPYVMLMMQNTALTVGLDVVGLVIAALFLISDFSVIQNCVDQHYPSCSFTAS